ncbi:MAG: tRNA lysidine(34) synthetase TilS [Candidatus Gracilibacteria bacterium]
MMDLEIFLSTHYKLDEKIILACSTGPDSIFLLHKILETKYKDNLVVCYFNHKLRPEADEEEIWIEKLGKKYGFKVEIAEANIKEIRNKLYPSKGLEEVAREKRYAFLNAILNIYESDKVITGHHLDDKIETFFFNLVRGSKLTGLINMTEKSGAILRPLLNTEKKDILNYLKKNKLEYKIDETNFDTSITRNKLRHDIIPKFEQINSNYKNNLNNLITYLEEVKENIDKQIIEFLNKYPKNEFNITDYNSLSSLLQKEIIRHIFYISNGKSTIGLSEANINEVIRFINGKGNKTVKEIKNMKLFKDNKVIKY